MSENRIDSTEHFGIQHKTESVNKSGLSFRRIANHNYLWVYSNEPSYLYHSFYSFPPKSHKWILNLKKKIIQRILKWPIWYEYRCAIWNGMLF